MNQPKALYFLNFISMWECFSYYGMRVLLILFMISEWGYNEFQALSVYALYSTLIEFGSLLGGFTADRFLGIKNTVKLGGVTIFFGHMTLMIPDSEPAFYMGLGLIIAGTSFFRSNLAALLGEFYSKDDSRRESGYTLYYTGINLGAFLATIGCGFFAENYGWNYGFGLAAIGMFMGMVVFFFADKTLFKGRGECPKSSNYKYLLGICILASVSFASVIMLYFSQIFNQLFLVIISLMTYFFYKHIRTKGNLSLNEAKRLALYVVVIVLFYGCEEQLGSSMLLFAEKYVDRETLFGLIPSSSIIMGNPLTILIMGPLVSLLMKKQAISISKKIGVSFFLLSLAFLILFVSSVSMEIGNKLSVIYMFIAIGVLSLGELFIGPTIYAAVSEMSSTNAKGLTMGIMTVGFSLANLFGGFLSQILVTSEETSLRTYANNFLVLALIALCIASFSIVKNLKEKIA